MQKVSENELWSMNIEVSVNWTLNFQKYLFKIWPSEQDDAKNDTKIKEKEMWEVCSYLSSWPWIQVEMKRQQASGQGMIWYWPHHLQIILGIHFMDISSMTYILVKIKLVALLNANTNTIIMTDIQILSRGRNGCPHPRPSMGEQDSIGRRGMARNALETDI